MSKREWDGNFCDSQYTETGNIVNDVIENNGRILHEATVDGYTHEMVDRGAYISDDYYFPRRTPGGKRHVHYEMRSNGEVLIDGKNLITGGTDTMKYGHQLGLRKNLDETILQKEAGIQIDERTRLHELGNRFEADKAKLEDEIEIIQNSKMSQADKQKLIAQLNASIKALQEQYTREVEEEEARVQKEQEGQIESMQEAADELEHQASELRGIKMDVATTDASAAADAAEAQKQAFEQMKAEYTEKLNLQIEQATIQQRNIRNRRLDRR